MYPITLYLWERVLIQHKVLIVVISVEFPIKRNMFVWSGLDWLDYSKVAHSEVWRKRCSTFFSKGNFPP